MNSSLDSNFINLISFFDLEYYKISREKLIQKDNKEILYDKELDKINHLNENSKENQEKGNTISSNIIISLKQKKESEIQKDLKELDQKFQEKIQSAKKKYNNIIENKIQMHKIEIQQVVKSHLKNKNLKK